MEKIKKECTEILNSWLESCRRNNKIARNTIAMGIVVLDHFMKMCPVLRGDVVSRGGEVSGARSSLGKTLESHGVPAIFLKEITTRQSHQDGQRLFEMFDLGKKLEKLKDNDRKVLVQYLIEILHGYADTWLKRQNLKLKIDRRQAPSAWVNIIVESAKGRSCGIVEQQLIGAKLARRFRGVDIQNHPTHAADKQTGRMGDFVVSNLVYHVTAVPSRNVLKKCEDNLKVGLHPILLVPRDQENKMRILAQDEGIDENLTIVSIENFIALNIIELAADENKDFFSILKEIVEIYNNRLLAVETDLSLQIEVR